ncbi:MAG: Ntn hydrolase family protein [Desulfobaccales bacterium]
MGQLIACAAAEGVLVASDSRAVFFEPFGEERFITVDRIMPVTSHAVLASAGNWEAAGICRDFAKFAQDEGLTDMDELIEAALPYFTGRCDEILRKMCEKIPPDPIVNMYLLLAGYSKKTPDHPGHLFVMWDRPQPPKIESNRVTDIFTLPRRMGLEFKLNDLVKKKAPLAQLVDAAKAGMEKLAPQDNLIGPPYHYVTITEKGIAGL